MKTRHIILGASLFVCGWLAFFGDKSSNSEIAEPVVRSSTSKKEIDFVNKVPAARSNPKGKGGEEPVILTLRSRDELVDRINPGKSTNTLFASHSWAPPPPPPPPPAAALPPMAPPLPFAYLGKKIEEGQWEAYLARGDQTFIAREQTVIENNYRVDAVKPPSLTLTYLPLNQVQTLYIGGTD